MKPSNLVDHNAPSTGGLFGGSLVFDGARSWETAPPEVLACLAADTPSPSVVSVPSVAGLCPVEIVRFGAVAGRIEYSSDLSGLSPLWAAALSSAERVSILARVASVVSAMHAAGQSHGDLGPWSVRVGAGRVTLLSPRLACPRGPLVALRIRHTAGPLTDAAFCSGSALSGREGGPAEDVYALAGIAFWLLSGELPVGHLDLSTAPEHLRSLGMIIQASLAASPARRPPLAALEAALWQAIPGARAQESEHSGAGFQAPAKALGAALPEAKQLSTVLTLLLSVGGLFVLVGALWIVAVGWSILGEIGRFGLLFALTTGIVGAGFVLEKRGYQRSGFALVVLGSQMLWADGAYVLNLGHWLESAGAWALVAALVTSVSTALALRRQSLGAGVLASLGFAVFAVCFNTATGRPGQLAFFTSTALALFLGGVLAARRERPLMGTGLLALSTRVLWIAVGCVVDLTGSSGQMGAWAAAAAGVFLTTLGVAIVRRSTLTGLLAALDFMVFSALFSEATGRPGELGLSLGLTLAAALTGFGLREKGNAPTGALLLVVATQLLWLDAGLVLDSIGALRSSGGWTLASSGVLAFTYALTLWRCPGAGFVAAFDAVIYAGCLGAFLSHGEPLGPPVYTLCVAGFFAGLAAAVPRGQKPDPAVWFSLFGLLALLLSATLGVSLLRTGQHMVFATLWPALGFASLIAFAWRATGAHRTLARVGAALILGFAPLVEAALCPSEPAYVVGAAVVGASAVIVALRVRDSSLQTAGAMVGLINASLVPSSVFLFTCLRADGLSVLFSPAGPYLVSALGAPCVLITAAAFTRPAPGEKSAYRSVELVALSQLFGLSTLASLVRADDFFHPGVVLVTGALSLVLGVTRRHVMIVGLASGALLVNLWIQYFEKLRDAFPTAALVLGFGLGLLGAGILYERKVRHMLPKLRDWS